MHSRLLSLALLLPAAFACAQPDFPGLRHVLTEAEWRQAGLERLAPHELGVIDAALLRHLAERSALVTESAAALNPAPASDQRGLRERFGFSRDRTEPHWREQPVLTATVVRWEGANRFVLDNGHVWEGLEPIPYELTGRTIMIEPRPAKNHALRIDGQTTAVRVRRVK